MKNNLGKIIIILILLHLNVLASTYTWSVESNKKVAMINEAIYLKYVCEYSDEAGLYVIEFNPVVDNDLYSIEILSEQERIIDSKKINTYEFILFVKKAQKITIALDTTMKKTNKDSIQNTVLGRDNAYYEEFSKRFIKQKAISIDVKQSNTDLVGEFVLNIKKDKEKVKAYEPYNIELKIEGIGNFKNLMPIAFNIDGVKVFSQKVVENTKLTKEGQRGTWSQKFAFVSEKDFEIPEIKIEYFDLKEQKIKEMLVESINVEVEKAYKKQELLDVEKKGFEFSSDFIYYILSFITGFLFAKIKLKKTKKQNSKEITFETKIQEAKSLKELMVILALKDSKKYESIINKIEDKKIKTLKMAKNVIVSINNK